MYRAQVELEFGGFERSFALYMPQIMELEDRCGQPGEFSRIGKSIAEIYQGLSTITYTSRDVVETIRLGLIGAGMKPHEAREQSDRICSETNGVGMTEAAKVAAGIIGASFFGVPVEPTGDDSEKKPQPPSTES